VNKKKKTTAERKPASSPRLRERGRPSDPTTHTLSARGQGRLPESLGAAPLIGTLMHHEQ